MDLADAHIRALTYLMENGKSDSFNLGNGNGHSVREVIDIVKRVSQRDFKVVEAERREGDTAILISSGEKAMELLNWRPQYRDIEVMVGTAWKWHQKALAIR